MKNILVCGAGGFIGAYLVEKLKAGKPGGTKKALKLNGGNRQSGIMRGCAVIILGLVWAWAGQAPGKWGMVASNTVQVRKLPRFSVTASECISAVPVSQGIKEAFSTGSQNHHPPQPNS